MTVPHEIFDDITPAAVAPLAALGNPFDGVCWPDLERPITTVDVGEALVSRALRHPDEGDCTTRAEHAGRIAWFIVNGWRDPIEVDVGIPSMGYVPEWPIQDGNHRLAAAILLKCRTIDIRFSGSLDFAEEIGLLEPFQSADAATVVRS